MEETCIGFIGLGLIGGSIAKAIHKQYPDYRIIAFDHNPETLALALEEQTIQQGCEAVDERFASCDYIFLCTPVSNNILYLKPLKEIIKPGCLLTDVGSVKGNIHQVIHELGLDHCFIGGHPMAGSEKSGYEYANDHLIENVYYILTPAGEVGLNHISNLMELVTKMGAIPMILTHEEHDYITATVSHLPHIIASALVNLVAKLDSPEEHMKMIAAGGFKDLTRIASSSAEMWQQICLTNCPNLSKVLDEFIRYLIQIRVSVDNCSAADLYHLFASSKEYRSTFEDGPTGLLKKEFVLYCDIIDEAGAIATIATTLACNGISIKNIGIIHSREFEEGALRIVFYEQQACKDAAEVLKSNRYVVFERS